MPERVRKMRIQLFDIELNMLSDRLVDPDVEFRKGPKDINPGPIGMELFLQTQEDVSHAVSYLQQLSGLVPIAPPTGKRGRKSKKVLMDGDAIHTTAIQETVDQYNDPGELFKWLREQGFIGITIPYLKDLGLPISIEEDDYPQTRFMVRLIRKAKNPLNNVYDPSILVGWKKVDGLDSVVCLSGKDVLIRKTFKDSLKDKIVIPAKYKTKFPPYLLQDDRNKFRLEMGKLQDDRELKPSRFYCRWVHDVARLNPKEMEFPRIDQIPNPHE